jgi:tRNA modification GTPase
MDCSPEAASDHQKRIQVALLTPPGRSAVATIGVRGSGAAALVDRFFTPAAGRPVTAIPVGRVVFGRFQTVRTAEEVVVGLAASDEVEIHGHGGTAAVEAVLTALEESGAQRTTWQDWLRQAVPDWITAEAWEFLAASSTERTAAILLDQARGALRREWNRVGELLHSRQCEAAAAALDALADRIEMGRHLTQPWQVVIAGRPNVGKSTLLNALLGYQRAIVFPKAGTTRDVLTAATAIDGWPVELADTAGLRESGEDLESEGIGRARQTLAAADLVLLVLDATAEWEPAFVRELGIQRRTIIVHNKADLSPPPADGRPAGLAISAATGAGLKPLLEAISSTLVPDPPPPGAAVPFSPRQVAMIEQAQRATEQSDSAAIVRLLRATNT